ncbi:MAG TPA: hypothetical protein VGG98_06180 [Solirubrobacteraceae bacterium]
MASSLETSPDPQLGRWKTGHRILHGYLIVMVTILDEMVNYVSYETERRVSSALLELTTLNIASTASMRYATSFSIEAYEQVIRPSMMPPATRAGFSGALNTDHRRMLEGMDALSSELDKRFGHSQTIWPPDVLAAWEALLRARREVHRNHGLVCRQFVDGPSLLRLHRVRDDNS